jgi:arsenate reductase
VYNLLFLCTGNSARSIIAEAVANHESRGGKFRAYSAGSFPTGAVNPLALATLKTHGYETDGLRSKSWDEFAATGAPAMDFVITVCDKAAGEVCPIWPGHPISAHWGVPDPAAVTGSEAERRRAFDDTLLVMRRRIDLLDSLPLEALSAQSLQEKVRSIGQA